MAPVESGGVGWSPSSAAERPGLFRPLKGAADDGPDVEEEVAGATLAASFALRSAAGFITRKGLLSGLAGLCRPPGVISRPTLPRPWRGGGPSRKRRSTVRPTDARSRCSPPQKPPAMSIAGAMCSQIMGHKNRAGLTKIGWLRDP